MDAITITSIIVAVLLFADLIYYIFIHVQVNKLERELNNIITTHEGEVEYLEEKTSNPCFCAIYFLSLRNLWIVRHERI